LLLKIKNKDDRKDNHSLLSATLPKRFATDSRHILIGVDQQTLKKTGRYRKAKRVGNLN
jgi:hypothetical protein